MPGQLILFPAEGQKQVKKKKKKSFHLGEEQSTSALKKKKNIKNTECKVVNVDDGFPDRTGTAMRHVGNVQEENERKAKELLLRNFN